MITCYDCTYCEDLSVVGYNEFLCTNPNNYQEPVESDDVPCQYFSEAEE